MNDREAAFGQVDRSRACAAGAHDDCIHFAALGGGFNPRRLRLEFGAALCPCECHSSCPVATRGKRLTVSPEAWRESCTCPGAVQARQASGEFPDFGKNMQDARRRRRARKDAFESARARAAGQGRDEIREIYVAELRARGLAVPEEDVLDAIVSNIAGNPFPAVRIAADSLVQLGKELRALSRPFL